MTISTISFPAMLPCMQRTGYAYRTSGGVLRTEMESGMARQRQRSRYRIPILSATWLFTPLELAVFEYFVEKKLQRGALAFNARILTGLGVTLETIRIVNGDYQTELRQARWAVNAELELLTLPTISTAQWTLVEAGLDLEKLL